MEINKDNIAEVFASDEYKNDILPLITASDTVQQIIGNKADSIFQEKITEEVAKTHKKYDEDMFEILGERPGTNEDGSKMKTYNHIKQLYGELKDLRGQKDSLTKDAEVTRLTGEIERLKTEGGGAQIKAMFDQAKTDWTEEKQGLLQKITEASQNNDVFQKKTAVSSAFNGIKWNPDINETVKDLVIKQAEAELIKNSELKDGKLIFLNADGKPALNDKWEPKTASEMLSSMESIKAISLNEVKKGGGADTKVNGSIQTIEVEGKDAKTLVLQEGSFKTKEEFQKIAQKAMLDSGVSRRDKEWQPLLDKAYKEYKVAEMPRQ